MNPRDVVKYIEGEPKIGVVPTEPGLTNVNVERVVGMNTENTEINEGTINFDIVFYVRMNMLITLVLMRFVILYCRSWIYDLHLMKMC